MQIPLIQHYCIVYSSAYDAAAALGLTTDRMTQARVTLDRDQLVADTEAKVSECMGRVTKRHFVGVVVIVVLLGVAPVYVCAGT